VELSLKFLFCNEYIFVSLGYKTHFLLYVLVIVFLSSVNSDVIYSLLHYKWIDGWMDEKCIEMLNNFKKSNPIIISVPLSGIENDDSRVVEPI